MLTRDDISRAFADIHRPPPADMFDEAMLPGDKDKAARVFIARDRSALALGDIAGDSDLLHYMRPGTFAYFLPRLLELCLDDPDGAFEVYLVIEAAFSAAEREADPSRPLYGLLDQVLDDSRREVVRRFFEAYRAACPDARPGEAIWA